MTVWMTYRKDFDQIPGSSSRSDAGWGCMLRTAQMLFHEAIKRHTGEERIDLFLDTESQPFSI
jgi:cysteine protease ATG4